jgi:hypothetical protein
MRHILLNNVVNVAMWRKRIVDHVVLFVAYGAAFN